MARGKRTRVAEGIYRDKAGYSVMWREQGKKKETRHELDTPLYKLKEHRRAQVERAAKQPKADTRYGLARDVVRYLRTRKGRAGYKAERSHLRAWVHAVPRTSRWALTREQAQRVVADWQAAGKSPQTVWHRVKALRAVYRTLDGPHVHTPLDDLNVTRPAVGRPRHVPEETIRKVAIRLREQVENDGRMKSPKTLARFLVLASTGQRPAQMMRAVRGDVDLERRVWFVRPAKGDRGTVVWLNEDMLAAWRLFIEADAWGTFSSSAFARALQRAGWPQDIPPYNLRHTVGALLSERDEDMADISALLGHSSIDVTRRFYVPAQLARMRALSERLEGRLAGLVPPASSTTAPSTAPENAETGGKRKKPSTARVVEPPRRRRAKSA